MKSTNFPQFVLLLIMLNFSNTLTSQNKKQVVILVNSQPVLVELDADGSIHKVVDDASSTLTSPIFKTEVFKKDSVIVDNNSGFGNNQLKELINTKASKFKLVPFDHGFATLSDKSILILDDIINDYKKDLTQGLLIQAILSDDSLTLLNNNRINSVRSYFKIRGIDISKVRYEILKGDVNIDEIKVSFIK